MATIESTEATQQRQRTVGGEQVSISDEAVEAAAKKLYQASGLTVWDKEDESTRNFYQRNAKSALEAAAPYMQAPVASGLEDQDDLEAILKQERWKYVAMKDEGGRPDGGYFEQSNDKVAQAIIRAGFRKVTL